MYVCMYQDSSISVKSFLLKVEFYRRTVVVVYLVVCLLIRRDQSLKLQAKLNVKKIFRWQLSFIRFSTNTHPLIFNSQYEHFFVSLVWYEWRIPVLSFWISIRSLVLSYHFHFNFLFFFQIISHFSLILKQIILITNSRLMNIKISFNYR